MHLELANNFLTLLHQFAEEHGYSSYASSGKMAEHFGVKDREKVRSVLRLLETRGLIRVVWIRDPMVSLSEEGALFVESGNALAVTASNPGAINIDQSTHFYGSVSGSAVSVRSSGGTQTVTNGTDAEAIIGQIVTALGQDKGLSSSERADHVTDAENLGRELKKSQPNKSVVNSYLSSLGAVASIARLVATLVALL